MDAYEALKETFDDLFQQAVEEGCYTEDEAAELVESLDIYSLLQVVRHNATTVYSYITQGRQERSFNYRGEDLFRQKATLLYEETDQVTMEIVVATRTLELWLLEDMSLAVVSCVSVNYDHDGYITQYRTIKVLHDVNLAIRPGTMTALVGPSGSGKSTVAKLIAGYWDVTSGSITLGGYELKDIPLSEISDQISYVSQDNYLFNRSIRENIRMGKPGATDAEVEQAAKQSGCDAFIRKLDNGYDTKQAAGTLSGGEKQRISIARAMLKNAPVVILDEATAYIDPENEALVQKAISALTVGKTLIVIAHRLSTIVGADNIVVVKDGTVHAQGTHAKLLETCPLYRDMWQAHIGAKDQM